MDSASAAISLGAAVVAGARNPDLGSVLLQLGANNTASWDYVRRDFNDALLGGQRFLANCVRVIGRRKRLRQRASKEQGTRKSR
jgi:hypothetical protein